MKQKAIRRRLLAGLTTMVTALMIGAAAPRPSAASVVDEARCPLGSPTGTTVPDQVAGGRDAVVFVHGWNGAPDSMAALRAAVDERLGNRVATFSFDYLTSRDNWAGDPEVAGCLALYVDTVSAASVAGGGHGTVYLVGHSMGGLAARYASRLTVGGRSVGEVVGGVVTINTPHRGSPWGGTGYARLAAELAEFLASKDYPLPDAAKDGARCLAAHTGGDSFPSACGVVPPYLPEGVPLAQVAGDVTVTRKFFGIPLYTYHLMGDSIVDIDSQLGYPRSGPGDAAMPRTKITSTTVECNVGTDELRLPDSHGAGAVIGVFVTDNRALDEILAGQVSYKLALPLALANLKAECSHVKITTHPETVDATVTAIETWLEAVPDTAAAGPAALVGWWGGEVFQHNNGRRYPVEISYWGGPVGSIVGTVIYPTLACGGDLRLESASADRVELTELITWGRRKCVLVVPMRLVAASADTVDYTFYRGSTLNGEATLRRLGSTVDTVPDAFVGIWQGMMEQPTSPRSPYSMHVSITAGPVNSTVATVTYADLRCSGEWSLRWADPQRLIVWEDITTGTSNCNDGLMVVTPAGDGLFFEFFRDGQSLEGSPSSWATLART